MQFCACEWREGTLSQAPKRESIVWVCVCTQAGVSAVRVYHVSGSTGADEAGAIEVGAFMLAQFLLTIAVMAKIWNQITWITFFDTIQKTLLISSQIQDLLTFDALSGLVCIGRI